jgi:predicted RNA-binding Zn ribbon-like protein
MNPLMEDRGTAPGVLGLLQAYVNTVDLEDSPEEFSDPSALGSWLIAHGLMEPGLIPEARDLKNAIAVREAIRGVIAANSGAGVYPVDIAILNEAATVSRLRIRFGSDGKARLEPEAGGVVGAMGRVVGAVFTAMTEADWARLKLCDSQTCRWVFYDQSRNRSSRWCAMADCGNREKARRFRQRAKPAGRDRSLDS